MCSAWWKQRISWVPCTVAHKKSHKSTFVDVLLHKGGFCNGYITKRPILISFLFIRKQYFSEMAKIIDNLLLLFATIYHSAVLKQNSIFHFRWVMQTTFCEAAVAQSNVMQQHHSTQKCFFLRGSKLSSYENRGGSKELSVDLSYETRWKITLTYLRYIPTTLTCF